MTDAHDFLPRSNVGRLWWIADSNQEFVDCMTAYTSKGAVLVKAWFEAPGQINYIIAMEKDRAQHILGHAPDESEWLLEDDDHLLPVIAPNEVQIERSRSVESPIKDGEAVGIDDPSEATIPDDVLDAWNKRHDLRIADRTDLWSAFEDAMSYAKSESRNGRSAPVGRIIEDTASGIKYGALFDHVELGNRALIYATPRLSVPTADVVELACRVFYGERWSRMDQESPRRWMWDALHAVFYMASGHDSFQTQAGLWMGKAFIPSLYSDINERGDRLLEEVFELLQAKHYPRDRIRRLENYVYGRPVGEPHQELGGVMVTLACYAKVAGLNMHAEGYRELARINRPEIMAKIREKQEKKNALHLDSPLPGDASLKEPL